MRHTLCAISNKEKNHVQKLPKNRPTQHGKTKNLCCHQYRWTGSWEKGVLDAASLEKFIKLTQPPFRIIALNVSETFKDMPGFSGESQNFYSAVLGLNGPAVESKLINESDIPAKVLAIDFPADYDGHYEEIYAINTRDWDSSSSRLVAEYLESAPGVPKLSSPLSGENNNWAFNKIGTPKYDLKFISQSLQCRSPSKNKHYRS